MPQTMSVDGTEPGREVKKLHAHGEHDPSDDETGPHSPGATRFAVPVVGEPGPEDVLDDTAGNVGRHVVGVVPPDALEVADVHDVEQDAEERPHTQQGAAARGRAVDAEDADRGIVHAVEDGGAGGEVVELLSERVVARVEDGGEAPGEEADDGEADVEWTEGVRGRDLGADHVEAVVVGGEVAEGPEDAQRLLHAEEAVEGPFSVELDDGMAGGDTASCNDVLALVIAFAGAVPE